MLKPWLESRSSKQSLKALTKRQKGDEIMGPWYLYTLICKLLLYPGILNRIKLSNLIGQIPYDLTCFTTFYGHEQFVLVLKLLVSFQGQQVSNYAWNNYSTLLMEFEFKFLFVDRIKRFFRFWRTLVYAYLRITSLNILSLYIYILKWRW